MSIDAVLARIQELTATVQPPQAVTTAPTGTASSQGFGGALQTAIGTTGATGSGATDATTNPFAGAIQAASQRNGVDPALVTAIVRHESSFRPDATSSVGAMGLMQLMPQTAAGLGVTNGYDPLQNLDGGTRLLRQLLDHYSGNLPLALAAYSAGEGAVAQYGGIPPYPETQNYVQAILAQLPADQAALDSTTTTQGGTGG